MSTRHSLTGEKIDSKICVSSRSAFKIVGPIETPMMITDTDNGQINFETSGGSDVIRAHDNRVTSSRCSTNCAVFPSLRRSAWVNPIYMAHVIPVKSCERSISSGWNQCFDSWSWGLIPPEPLNFLEPRIVISSVSITTLFAPRIVLMWLKHFETQVGTLTKTRGLFGRIC